MSTDGSGGQRQQAVRGGYVTYLHDVAIKTLRPTFTLVISRVLHPESGKIECTYLLKLLKAVFPAALRDRENDS